MVLSICNNPDVLSAMMIINNVILIIKILAPVILILTGIISLSKTVINNDNIHDAVMLFIVKLFVAAFIFFIPNCIKAVVSLTSVKMEYKECFTNATRDNIRRILIQNAQELVKVAEKSLKLDDYKEALYAVNRLEEGTTKTNLSNRLVSVKSDIDKDLAAKIEKYYNKHEGEIYSNPVQGTSASGDPLTATGGQSSTGGGVAKPGVPQTSEPDPSAAVNYWKKYVNPNNFFYPKDQTTGLPLGAWPINYQSIPTQLTNYKIHNGGFVFPTTPTKNSYRFVYNHNGMDIMAVFGTPIYSPVDGTLTYSEWGHTLNNGGDETAYTVSIKLTNPITFSGKKIQNAFMTHMCGIRYRCSYGRCNRTIKKGELIGFVGTAAGSATSIGYAPHLHITLYPTNYEDGLYTAAMEAIFDLPKGTSGYTIVAGG